MKTQSHRDRLIAALPADLQAGALEACQAFSTDGNDPVEGLFASSIEITNRKAAENEAQVRELQKTNAAIQASLERAREESRLADQKINRRLEALQPGTTLKRLLLSRAAEIIIILTLILTLTPVVINHSAGVIAREAQKQTAILEKAQAEQSAHLATIVNDPAAMVAYVKFTKEIAERSNKTNATLAAIANLLYIPESVIAYQNGKMTIRLNRSDIEYTTADRYAYLTFKKSAEDLYGMGETVPEKLEAAAKEAAKVAEKPKADGK